MNSGIGFAGPMATHTAVRKSRRFSWDQKRVLITGGSRDLGLALARQVAARGARLAICGQTVDQLDHSVREVRRYTRDAIGIACDMRDPNSVTRTMAEIESEFGGVDVLVNLAGINAAGPFDSITQAEFVNTMYTNCRGAFRAIQAALPLMRHQGWGRILNIASMGGQRPVPDMLPDAAREFVWFGISDSLKTKLKHENILISTAFLRLSRTGSLHSATFNSQHREEYAWSTIGDSLPLMSMNADEAAAQIIEACQLR